jgi:hypothetical protein
VEQDPSRLLAAEGGRDVIGKFVEVWLDANAPGPVAGAAFRPATRGGDAGCLVPRGLVLHLVSLTLPDRCSRIQFLRAASPVS